MFRVKRDTESIATWLILPVVICLSKRLSHASVSISIYTVKLRKAHYISYSLFGRYSTWIPVVILELIHATVPIIIDGRHLLDKEPFALRCMVSHSNFTDRIVLS